LEDKKKIALRLILVEERENVIAAFKKYRPKDDRFKIEKEADITKMSTSGLESSSSFPHILF